MRTRQTIGCGSLLGVFALALAACASGPPRRVSEPAASIQQLTVQANGNWLVDLRMENFSSVPMRFDAISLPLTLNKLAAGTLQGNAGISIGPESADIVTLPHVPTVDAKLAMADALSAGRSIGYSLEGTVQAAPEDGKSRLYDIERDSALSPVPGLPGVLR